MSLHGKVWLLVNCFSYWCFLNKDISVLPHLTGPSHMSVYVRAHKGSTLSHWSLGNGTPVTCKGGDYFVFYSHGLQASAWKFWIEVQVGFSQQFLFHWTVCYLIFGKSLSFSILALENWFSSAGLRRTAWRGNGHCGRCCPLSFWRRQQILPPGCSDGEVARLGISHCLGVHLQSLCVLILWMSSKYTPSAYSMW